LPNRRLQTRCKQTGILTNDPNSVKRPRLLSPIYPENKKRRNLLATFRGNATLKVVTNSLFSNPLHILIKRNGHYRDKNLLVNSLPCSQSNFISLREARVFQKLGLDAPYAVGLSSFE